MVTGQPRDAVMLPETRSLNADQLDSQHATGTDVQLWRSQRAATATGRTANPTATTATAVMAVLRAFRHFLADRRHSTSARYQSRSSKPMPPAYICGGYESAYAPASASKANPPNVQNILATTRRNRSASTTSPFWCLCAPDPRPLAITPALEGRGKGHCRPTDAQILTCPELALPHARQCGPQHVEPEQQRHHAVDRQ
jgi:hypothetical protein